MKPIKILFLLFSICIFALSAAAFGSAIGFRKNAEQSQPQLSSEPDICRYTLRREGERLAIYRAGVRVAAVNVSFDDLPADELKLLESGVSVGDEAQLIAMLEDYTS